MGPPLIPIVLPCCSLVPLMTDLVKAFCRWGSIIEVCVCVLCKLSYLAVNRYFSRLLPVHPVLCVFLGVQSDLQPQGVTGSLGTSTMFFVSPLLSSML